LAMLPNQGRCQGKAENNQSVAEASRTISDSLWFSLDFPSVVTWSKYGL